MGGSLIQYEGIPIKRGNLNTEAQTQEECHVKMMHLQAREGQRLPANHQK